MIKICTVTVPLYADSCKTPGALTVCMENPVIPGRIQVERFVPVEIFPEKSNTFRGITFLSFLPKRPKFFVPFVWLTNARRKAGFVSTLRPTSLILRRPRSFAVPFASLPKGTANDLGRLRIRLEAHSLSGVLQMA